MDMEVMIPTAAVEFNFDSACTTPYISAASSPQRFGSFYHSAPTSPTRVSNLHNNDFSGHHHQANVSLSSVPFLWEEKPGIPKAKTSTVDDDDDFAFDFSGQLEVTSSLTTADELFDGGKIKPLKPPPGLTTPTAGSCRSPPNNNKQMIKETLFSPRRRHRKKGYDDDDFDPFAAALELQTTTRKDFVVQDRPSSNAPPDHQERGRERTTGCRNKKIFSGGGRSLSPFRVSDLLLDSEENAKEVDDGIDDHPPSSRFSTSSSLSSSFVSFWYRRKWKLKDLLLFRSASDGHAMTKEQLNKYAILKKKTSITEQQQEYHHQDVKSSSFRSTDSCGSLSNSSSRPAKGGGGTVSAHELHYRAKRAMAQDLKRKTSLPYKPAGFFGCLGFNPAAAAAAGGSSIHDISRNFGGSMSREHPPT